MLSQQDHQRQLNEIGIALSSEHDIERLLEMIAEKAKSIANADAVILFTRHETEDVLIQRLRHCDSLNIHVGGTTGEPTYGHPVELYDRNGKGHYESVTAYTALKKKSVNIDNISKHDEFDFSSTKAFDKRRGYQTQSVLAVPMLNKRKEALGVIRLSNAQDADGNTIPFDEHVQHLIESLASQGAVALDNDLLINGLEDLLQAVIKLIAKAIDQKSPHTGNHLQKIPIIMDMMVREASASDMPAFKDFNLTEEEIYEVSIASWLHDCGKLSTPDYILEKGKKLEMFFDRIELLRTRLEVLRRDAEIDYLKALQTPNANPTELKAEFEDTLTQINNDWEFLQHLNLGSEWVTDEDIERLQQIAKRQWTPQIDRNTTELESFLTHDELENLSVRRGTLTPSDRTIIQDHIVHSVEMLESMPFPRQLSRVPEYAGGHHEKIDGSGYPKGLTGDQMSIPAKMMAIADVFEALTSHDRPYKKPKTLSETYAIMKKMLENKEIDSDIMDLLWKTDLYKQYADRYLLPQQQDDIPL